MRCDLSAFSLKSDNVRFAVNGKFTDEICGGRETTSNGLALALRDIEPTFAELNPEGIATPADVIKHITPLGWQHISLTGDYIWTPTDSLDLRPFRRETSMLVA